MNLVIPKLSGDPLSISVDVGQQVFVVGPNGSGKSAPDSTWGYISGSAECPTHISPSPDLATIGCH